MRPRLLDLFCGAGGAAVGYARAGFEVVGVDHVDQPRYPFEFIQADALEFLEGGSSPWTFANWYPPFDAIHASPPCQRWTLLQNAAKRAHLHPDLITPLRPVLKATGLPYVIENVPGAPLIDPVRVCMAASHQYDGFELRRHRLFESSVWLVGSSCTCGELPAAPCYGHGPGRWFYRKYGRGFSTLARRTIMGVEWMRWPEEAEAVPPAFTELIGHQLMQHLRARAAA
ncbi:MAG: DNA cytosine methyltransferase [Gemmatimonadaceae bacterium]|nr:DNA cytosine methyltransferase [Gemmatimonadaceae bacterium]